MDVTFVLEDGRSFTIEVGYFDTVFDIKEKIQMYQGTPVSKQILKINEEVLQDEDDVDKCAILHNCAIQLIVASDSDPSPARTVQFQSLPPRTKIQVQLRTPWSITHLPVDINDTVSKLKQRIQAMEGKVVHKMVIHATGAELHDQQLLRDCGVLNNSEVDVSFKQPPPNSAAAGSSDGGGSTSVKKLKLTVLTRYGIEVPVEVNAWEKVREFRKELEILHEMLQFDLPKEGRYFFIHKQEVMEEDKSFRWHDVADGDTIDVFPGFVTSGDSLNTKNKRR